MLAFITKFGIVSLAFVFGASFVGNRFSIAFSQTIVFTASISTGWIFSIPLAYSAISWRANSRVVLEASSGFALNVKIFVLEETSRVGGILGASRGFL